MPLFRSPLHRDTQNTSLLDLITHMDWFSWLSKTGLEPSLVYEYGLSFAHNELEEEDIAYFNHEFLQSMGISIAKHRLEILKLARKEKGRTPPRAVAMFVVAIKKTKRCLGNYIRSWNHCENSALVVVPNKASSTGLGTTWKSAMMKRNKKLNLSMSMPLPKQERFFLTHGSPAVLPALPALDVFSSPVKEEKIDGEDDGYWSAAVEEIRWDTMFQNLKPN